MMSPGCDFGVVDHPKSEKQSPKQNDWFILLIEIQSSSRSVKEIPVERAEAHARVWIMLCRWVRTVSHVCSTHTTPSKGSRKQRPQYRHPSWPNGTSLYCGSYSRSVQLSSQPLPRENRRHKEDPAHHYYSFRVPNSY